LTDTDVLAKKVLIRGSTLIDEAIEKSRISQPQDQGSSDNRQEKSGTASKPDRAGCSFEPASCVTDASDLHLEKSAPKSLQRMKGCESTSNCCQKMQSHRKVPRPSSHPIKTKG
jgi:hypothetical protein